MIVFDKTEKNLEGYQIQFSGAFYKSKIFLKMTSFNLQTFPFVSWQSTYHVKNTKLFEFVTNLKYFTHSKRWCKVHTQMKVHRERTLLVVIIHLSFFFFSLTKTHYSIHFISSGQLHCCRFFVLFFYKSVVGLKLCWKAVTMCLDFVCSALTISHKVTLSSSPVNFPVCLVLLCFLGVFCWLFNKVLIQLFPSN